MTTEEIQQAISQIVLGQQQFQETQNRTDLQIRELQSAQRQFQETQNRTDLQIQAMDRQIGILYAVAITQQNALRLQVEEQQRDRRIAQERYEESNQRFNILLEEIRAINRRVTTLENQ